MRRALLTAEAGSSTALCLVDGLVNVAQALGCGADSDSGDAALPDGGASAEAIASPATCPNSRANITF